jgi:hypothetical protein
VAPSSTCRHLGKLTQIAFMLRLTRADTVVTSTAAVITGLLSDGRLRQAAGTPGIVDDAIPYDSFLINPGVQ